MKNETIQETAVHPTGKPKKEKGILKAIGSIFLAIVASSHHWVHTLLIAMGLTTLGTSLFSLSPWVKIGFMLFSLIISVWMIRGAFRKWNHHRSVALVYLISSVLSIIIVISALPQAFESSEPVQKDEKQSEQKQEHESHHP